MEIQTEEISDKEIDIDNMEDNTSQAGVHEEDMRKELEGLFSNFRKQMIEEFELRKIASSRFVDEQTKESELLEDLDLEEDDPKGKESGKKKTWREKMEKCKDKLIKKLCYGMRGRNTIEKMMIESYDNDLNKNNLYKNGNIEIRVNNIIPLIAQRLVAYIYKHIDNKVERELFLKNILKFYDLILNDIVLYIGEEVMELIYKLYEDILENKENINVFKVYMENRSEYLNTPKRVWKRRNNYKGVMGYYGNSNDNRNKKGNFKKRYCLDWNKKGSCSYPNCRFPHKCSGCESTQHGHLNCPSEKTNE